MSTRVLPVCGFPSYFNRMSELRRRLQAAVPTAAEQQQQQSAAAEQAVQQPHGGGSRSVRRNLFGPVDHEENLKFVHEELAKISKADNARWNFDFQKETPVEGRYEWKITEQGRVPAAYEMPNLTAKLTSPFPSTSKGTSVSAPVATNPTSSSSSSSSCKGLSATTVELCLKSVSSATTTVLSAKPRLSTTTTILSLPSLNENIISPVIFVDSGRISEALTKSSVVRPSTIKQPKITEFLKIGKRTHATMEDKRESEEAPPPALKRARTSS